MSSIFSGTKRLIKQDGTIDGRKLKRKIAENIEKRETKLELSRKTQAEIRETILDAITYLSRMNAQLPEKTFDFRIERHRHNANEPFSIRFRVGDSGKRFSAGIGLADVAMPVLKRLWLEQQETEAIEPLTPRALADVERLCHVLGY